MARVNGTNMADQYNGSALDDIYYGGLGNDQIFGGGGNDFLYGGDGDDYICAWTPKKAGNTYIEGGNGNDTIAVNTIGTNVIKGGKGNDTIILTGDGNSTITAYGGDNDDLIYYYAVGDKARALLYGGNENDHIVADGVGTIIEGGSGNDLLEYSAGWGGTIKGDAGADVIKWNGMNKDITVFGGTGKDEFHYTNSSAFSSNNNVIRDFSHRDGDTITLFLSTQVDARTLKYDGNSGEIYINAANYGGPQHCTLLTLTNKPSDFSISSDVRVIQA